MSVINPGDRLFHYNPNSKKITGCTVEAIIDKNIIIVLDEVIAGETELTLPLTHFGEWLFYEENHIGLGFDKLSKIEAYYRFENANIKSILSERKKFEKVLSDRQINNLVHFTRLENLRSILKHGLIPRNNHDSLNINACYNDMYRFDDRLDATSCSITFPNDKIFMKFREQYPNEKWAVILLDTEVILTKENICEFCMTNAANKTMRSQSGFELRHFQNMFKNEATVKKLDGTSVTYLREHIPDSFTTDVQAELLIRGKIDKKYIKKVVFDTLITKNEWYTNNSDIASDFCLDIVPEYFGWRTNFCG